eukprot:4605224-Pleurochrysis_carterae.AAC.7
MALGTWRRLSRDLWLVLPPVPVLLLARVGAGADACNDAAALSRRPHVFVDSVWGETAAAE